MRKKKRNAIHGKKTIDRFWTKVKKTESCWLWQASKTWNGYGRFRFRTRTVPAHCFSHFIAHGDWPSQLVLHRCDVRACVRPSHLFVGNQRTNIHDAMQKGRFQKRARNGRAKLTEADVRTIRRLAARGIAHKLIASRFGIYLKHVSRIATKAQWK